MPTPKLDHITIVIETLADSRAQVSVNIPTPTPGMRIDTAAHSLAIEALGWLGKQPSVAGFVYSPSSVPATAAPYTEREVLGMFGLAALQPGQGDTPTQAAHIVLDLETLSTQPNAMVTSIGAVALAASGAFVSEFHVALTTNDFLQSDRHVCPDTIAWWREQSEDAKQASINAADKTRPFDALQAFSEWVKQHADPKKVKVWGNGSSFDNVILSTLYARYPVLERPWAYWNDRDMRTVLDLYPHAKKVGDFEGVKHNALHDARYEAKQLAAVLLSTTTALAAQEVQEKAA